jgi:hypothetical protein
MDILQTVRCPEAKFGFRELVKTRQSGSEWAQAVQDAPCSARKMRKLFIYSHSLSTIRTLPPDVFAAVVTDTGGWKYERLNADHNYKAGESS